MDEGKPIKPEIFLGRSSLSGDQLEQWINEIRAAGVMMVRELGVGVQWDYEKGIIVPEIGADELTEAQKEIISRIQGEFPRLIIQYHKE